MVVKARTALFFSWKHKPNGYFITHTVSIQFHKNTPVVVKFHNRAVVKVSVCHSAVSFIVLGNVIVTAVFNI